MLYLIILFTFATAALVGFTVIPMVVGGVNKVNEKRQREFSVNMEQLLSQQEAKNLSQFFILAPFAFAALFYFLFPPKLQLVGVFTGIGAGFIFPSFYMRSLAARTKNKFGDQLIDALMIMSSSFRGGLSLVQALESVVEEMPDPIRKEFATVLGENKMGVSLEDALYHLYKRIPTVALQQMITSILLARETGGNLPVIFQRIVTNIREHKKIQQNLDTLTIQGKIQGLVMSFLPIGFVSIVYSSNKKIFDNMMNSELGQMMLILSAVLWVVGAIMIIKISSFKDF